MDEFEEDEDCMSLETVRELERELSRLRIYVEQLRGALGYSVSGDIPENPNIKNGIAEALNQELAECRQENDGLRARLEKREVGDGG